MAMTATSTRSTRRAEGLVAHPAQAHPQAPPQAQAQSQSQRATRHHQHLQQSNSSRPLKRLHEATNLAYDLKPPKKTKFEIEIPSKSQYQARLYPENIDSRHQHHRPARVASVTATHNKPPKHDARQAATTAPPPAAPEPTQAAAPRPAPPPAKTATTATTAQDKAASSPASSVAAHTKHREKVVNGIKHELDRLQPSSADMATNSQGRKLRSQEGVRYKSELSAYFPEYDEVIGNIPKEQHVLMLDTPIVLVDLSPSSSSTSLPRREPHPPPSTFPVRTYGDDLFTSLHDSQTIDLSWLESQYKGKTLTDPLPDAYYEPIHRKESRNEKITRNAEKGRSQHEKEQVIRLLDGLRGPDWLKTMGVSGITEGKKKHFEPARTHFINKCVVVLEKFRKWAAEEKRLKLEKDRAAKENRASQETGSAKNDENEEEDDPEVEVEELFEEEADEDDGAGGSNVDERSSDLPESDVDASAKQLHEEAMARSRMAARSTSRRPVAVPQAPPPTPPEFKSFFKKPYQREAALNKSRRRGRSVLAWGHPVPEPEDQDFDLPEEYRDDETMKSRARELRRMQRSTRNRA